MSSQRPLLRLLPDPVEPVPLVRFCGHCGAPPPEEAQEVRVCSRCGLGVVIAAGRDVAPAPGDPFVIVDRRLMICAVSRGAEKLLGVSEPLAVDRPVADLLEPADAEAGEPDALLQSIIVAAAGCGAPAGVVVRPAGEYGVRFQARIGSCGPPAGALVLLAGV